MFALERKILAATDKPLAYPEIESTVGKQLSPLKLGMALTRMVLNGELQYKLPSSPDSFQSSWPVYSKNAIPKRFKNPTRKALRPNT